MIELQRVVNLFFNSVLVSKIRIQETVQLKFQERSMNFVENCRYVLGKKILLEAELNSEMTGGQSL